MVLPSSVCGQADRPLSLAVSFQNLGTKTTSKSTCFPWVPSFIWIWRGASIITGHQRTSKEADAPAGGGKYGIWGFSNWKILLRYVIR